MLNGQSTAVIIPALNEAQSIAKVIADLPAIFDQIIVVDNGSTDTTADKAKAAGAQVVYEPQQGYGAACLAGIAQTNADVIAFVDGDYSDYPADLTPLVEVVSSQLAQLAVGVRTPEQCQKRAMPWHQRAGNWLMCCLIELLHGKQFSDLGPMRCINASTLASLNMQDKDYGWTAEMQIKAYQQQVTVKEFPVRYRARIGTSKISGTVKGTIMAAYKISYWTIKLLFNRPTKA